MLSGWTPLLPQQACGHIFPLADLGLTKCPSRSRTLYGTGHHLRGPGVLRRGQLLPDLHADLGSRAITIRNRERLGHATIMHSL